MKKIFIINAGQNFGHSGGLFNNTIAETTQKFFGQSEEISIQTTTIQNGYLAEEEVSKFAWADVIIYHTPVWWFQLPYNFKKYIDEVFTAGHNKGIYRSDGRKSANPEINYGTGGTMQGKKYMLTTTWNAPATAFTLPGEFFDQKSVDEGPFFGFHRMNAFTGMTPLKSYHFHDVEKNANIEKDMKAYSQHLEETFADSLITID